MIYKKLMKPLFFLIDPEKVHDFTIFTGRLLGSNFLTRNLTKLFFYYESPKLNVKVKNIKFNNPIGLAAGFDKNALLTNILPAVGFGHMEIGSVTGVGCEGNKKPRLFRLVKDKAILVYYGLANQGSKIIRERLKNKHFKIPLGISVAKVNDPKVKGKGSINDYVLAFKRLHKIGAYTTINVSCPNTGDGTTFCNPLFLNRLLKEVSKIKIKKPVFLKIKPGLSDREVNEMLKVCKKYRFITGFIISNLSKRRDGLKTSKKLVEEMPLGGISGKYVQKDSDELIKKFYKKTKGKYVIIGVGGIFNGKDAYEKIKNGATLLQLITGMIYNGPNLIKEIKKDLVELLDKDGFENIEQAVGKNIR